MRNILSLFLMTALLLSLCACSSDDTTDIGGVEPTPTKSISTSLGYDGEIELHVDDTYTVSFRLEGFSAAGKNDFILVTENSDILDAAFTSKINGYISYALTAKSVGECEVYLKHSTLAFESERLIFSVTERSPEYIVGAVNDSKAEIIAGYTKEIAFAVLGCEADLECLKLVISDESILKCTSSEVRDGYVYYKLKGLKTGQSSIRLETSDGGVKSGNITVFVIENVSNSGDEELLDGFFSSKNSQIFHIPTCSAVDTIDSANKVYHDCDREQMIAEGYTPCQKCNP